MPARYDKWTVPRTLLAVSAGEFAAQTAQARLLASGVSASLAATQSYEAGRAREREILAYWIALQSVKKVRRGSKTRLQYPLETQEA